MNRNRVGKAVGFAIVAVVLVALTAAGYVGGRMANSGEKALAQTAAPESAAHSEADGHEHGAKAAPAHEEGDGHDHGSEAADAHAEGEEGHEGEHVDEVMLTPEILEQNGITLDTARKEALNEMATMPGRVSYNVEAMAHVGTPVEGRIADIKVKLGDNVKKGDVLLVIDSPSLGEAQSEYLQKRTQLQVAESAVEVAKAVTDRAKLLLEGKGISLAEFQRRDGELKVAQGSRLTAQAALKAAENKLHLWGMGEKDIAHLVATGEVQPQYSVRAPLAGCVVQREATLGEIVAPERDALLVLADLKTIWVLADVPEIQLHRVQLGAPARIGVDAIPGQTFEGKVAYIGPELDKGTRTGQVRVAIANGHSPLKPGMFAQIRLPLGNQSDPKADGMIAVPETSVQTFEGGPTVFVEVEGEPNTYAAKRIEIGPAIGGRIPVLAGLEEGMRYVNGGSFIVKAQLAKATMEGKTCSGH